jgi:hypothetical protein
LAVALGRVIGLAVTVPLAFALGLRDLLASDPDAADLSGGADAGG